MPHYEEDMNKRREKRDAQRRKREADARRLRLLLIIAAVILVLCLAGISLLVSRQDSGTPEDTLPTDTQATQPAAGGSAIFQQNPLTTVHIRAAGDLNITDSIVNSGIAASGYNYSPAFRDVAALLADADLTVLNFEGNVCGQPYGTTTTSAPPEILAALRSAGVDLLQTANSCAINNGMNGLVSTLRAIRSAGIEPVGTFGSSEELRTSKGYTMTEVNGIKIAFVAFTKGLGGRGMPAGSEDLVNLLYTDYHSDYKKIDQDRITAILKNVEAEKPDLTVALLHWGSEYNDDISRTQKSIVSLMKKRGVDVIIGTHPHTVQPIDFDAKAGTLVAYSLGDFFGDAVRGGTNYSIILDLEITKDSTTGKTKVTDYSYIPIYTVRPGESDGDYAYSRVLRIDSALTAHGGNFLDMVTDATRDAMEYALTRIEARIIMPKDDD